MAQAYTSRTRTVGFLFSLILAAIFVLFGGNIVGLYNSNPEIIRIGGHIMLIVAFLQPFRSRMVFHFPLWYLARTRADRRSWSAARAYQAP